MALCIPKESAKKLVSAMKKLGDNPLAELEKLSSTERREFFSQFTDSNVAKELNSGLESAFLKGDKKAIMGWAKKNLKPQEAKEVAENIPELEKAIKSGEVYEDLINKELGTELSTEEVKKFSKLGKEVYELGEKNNIFDELGNPFAKNFEGQVKYLAKRKELFDYAQSISPHNNLYKRYVRNIWKAGVLMTAKSTGLNILGNSIVMITERGIDRIINKTLGTALSGLKKDYVKKVIKIYKESKFDISRSTGLDVDDSVIGAGKYAGEEISTPKSKPMKMLSNFVFEGILGYPDVISGATHRVDSAVLQAEALVKKTGKGDIEEIVKDSLRLTPQTEAGEIIQEISIHNARVGTFTNDGEIAEISVALKRLLNKPYNADIGEILMPFVKTPSNVIGMGFEYAGLGIQKPLRTIYKKLTNKHYEVTKKEFQENIKALVRGGVGLSTAFGLVSMIDIDDYIESYDPSKTQSRNIKGATPDSVKIGDKYWSLDYFGQLRTSMKFFLELKARGKIREAIQYTAGSELLNLPISQGFDVKETLEDMNKEGEKSTEKFLKKTAKNTLARIYSAFPFASQVGDITKGLDTLKRDTNTEKYSLAGISFDKIASKIPVLRETLPEKQKVVGGESETAGLWNIITGARSSKADKAPIAEEYRRLEDENFAPKFKDITYTNSKKVKEIEEEIGKQAIVKEKGIIRIKATKRIEDAIKTDEYKNLRDEDKKSFQEKVFNNEYDRFLNKYGKKSTFEAVDEKELLQKADIGRIEQENRIDKGGLQGGKENEREDANTFKAIQKITPKDKKKYIESMNDDDEKTYKKFLALSENDTVKEAVADLKKQGVYKRPNSKTYESLERMKKALVTEEVEQFMGTDEEFIKSQGGYTKEIAKRKASSLTPEQKAKVNKKLSTMTSEEKKRWLDYHFTKE